MIHLSGNSTITAVTYGFKKNMVFWTTGSSIFSTRLATNKGEGQLFGEIESLCIVMDIAYEWITGNFYISCKYSRVVVCASRPGSVRMLCSEQTPMAGREINWLSLNSKAGRVHHSFQRHLSKAKKSEFHSIGAPAELQPCQNQLTVSDSCTSGVSSIREWR